jgi:hypothetical protein
VRTLALSVVAVVAAVVEPVTVTAASSTTTVAAALPSGALGAGQQASLNAVSCPGVNTCVAVGSFRTSTGNQLLVLEEHAGLWQSPLRVAAPSGAVASTARLPNRITELLGVSCAKLGDCVAVGTYDTASGFEPLVLVETAGVWGSATALALPADAASVGQGAALDAVACVGADTCTAVGTYVDAAGNVPLAVGEKNGSWRAAVSPALPADAADALQGATLAAVTCRAAGTCVAVGGYVASTYRAVVLTETSGTWGDAASATAISPPADAATGSDAFTALNAVSCPSFLACVAVGQYAVGKGSAAMAVDESAGHWPAAVAVAAPATSAAGAPMAALDALSCAGGACEAVGAYGTSSLALPLVASSSAGAFSDGTTGELPDDAVALASGQLAQGLGVQCFSPGACLVVGAYVGAVGAQAFTSTPSTAPGAPGAVTAVAGRASASVSWLAPNYLGGAAITGYQVTAAPGGATCQSTSLTCVVGGLDNGTAYRFTATATNAVGTSAPSAPSAPVTPATVPGPPSIISLTALRGGFQLVIGPPTSNGGARISEYEYSLDGGVKWHHRSSDLRSRILTLTALARHHAYELAVRAVNAVGNGAPSSVLDATTR